MLVRWVYLRERRNLGNGLCYADWWAGDSGEEVQGRESYLRNLTHVLLQRKASVKLTPSLPIAESVNALAT